MNRFRFAYLLRTLWQQPTLLYGKGDTHERAFETLLQRHQIPFLRHPFGSQRWPDFHIQLDSSPLAVELKTTQFTTVCMGGTWPHPECIYLISHPQHPIRVNADGIADFQRLTLVRGSDLVPQEEKEAYDDYRSAVHGIPRVSSQTISIQPRTNLFVRLQPDKRDEWYQTTLRWVLQTAKGRDDEC